jgi:pSer/pThr/pTyr-binding forkhead associated (FHA) protein
MILKDETGARFAVRDGETVGRMAKGSEVLQGYPTVSRRHLVVVCREGRWSVRNLSSNGSYVNGNFADVGIELEVTDGDELMLSSRCRLTVVL